MVYRARVGAQCDMLDAISGTGTEVKKMPEFSSLLFL